jgi:hypothetical protein
MNSGIVELFAFAFTLSVEAMIVPLSSLIVVPECISKIRDGDDARLAKSTA